MDDAHPLTGSKGPIFGDRTSTRWMAVVLCAVIAVAVFFIYARVASYGFVSYDDPDYVTENPNVRGGLSRAGIRWAFTSYHVGHWHPLTWLSHMLDCQLFGIGPASAGSHHLVSVGLHIANSMLLLFAFRRMTGQLWPSALAAALFAVHPLRVESVAWIAGRKDVLSGLFFMLTLLAYSWYIEHRCVKRYVLLISAFALGLLAKPMLVTLPFVLLLLDFWPLTRLQFGAASTEKKEIGSALSNPQSAIPNPKLAALLLEKVPLLILSLGFCVVTALAQHAGGAVRNLQTISPAWRVVNALVAYAMYLFKSVWPTNLAILYPHPALDSKQQFMLWFAVAAVVLLVLVVLTVAAVRTASRWPFLLVGWLWYLGMLIPVIGLVQVGLQARADRFGYLPLIGLYIMAAWGLYELIRSYPKARHAVSGLVCCGLLALAISARGQVAVWKDSQTLFENALEVTTNNFVAHTSLGNALLMKGLADEAVEQFAQALQIEPNYAEAHNGWGLAVLASNQVEEARQRFDRAARLRPEMADFHNNLGSALVDLGRTEAAISRFQQALRLDPSLAAAHNNWGRALAIEGKLAEAAEHFREAIRLEPANSAARQNLGRIEMLLEQRGRSSSR